MKIKHTLVSNFMINIIRRLTEPTELFPNFGKQLNADKIN